MLVKTDNGEMLDKTWNRRSLDVVEVREACAKVCDEIRNSARRDYERHLAANGGKFRYGSGDPANFSNAREADFSMAAERIRALDLGQINAANKP